jgi:deoxyribonuclease IV
VHWNDSLYPHGSKRDRHAPIGQGHIGAEGFRQLLQSQVIRNVPLFLETPRGLDGTHREEIHYVKHLSHE